VSRSRFFVLYLRVPGLLRHSPSHFHCRRLTKKGGIFILIADTTLAARDSRCVMCGRAVGPKDVHHRLQGDRHIIIVPVTYCMYGPYQRYCTVCLFLPALVWCVHASVYYDLCCLDVTVVVLLILIPYSSLFTRYVCVILPYLIIYIMYVHTGTPNNEGLCLCFIYYLWCLIWSADLFFILNSCYMLWSWFVNTG